MIADAKHKLKLNQDETDVDITDIETLKIQLNKDRKKIKRWNKKYQGIMASESLIKLIPRVMGSSLGKIGNFPHVVKENEDPRKKA